MRAASEAAHFTFRARALRMIRRDFGVGLPGEGTTIDRQLRHRGPKILWFSREFFLTTFRQPTILRSQIRQKRD